MSDAAAAPEYQHYPLVMRHPNFVPAVLGKGDQMGRPAKFPQVTVQDGRQEEYYRAQGYVPAGKTDPVAYHAAVAPQDLPTPTFGEFPMWIEGFGEVKNEAERIAAEAEVQRRAEEAAARQTEQERQAAIEAANGPDGLRARLEGHAAAIRGIQAALGALAAQQPQSAFTKAVRAMFEDRAEAAGVATDGRWALDRLINAVAEAEAAAEGRILTERK